MGVETLFEEHYDRMLGLDVARPIYQHYPMADRILDCGGWAGVFLD
jgi:hypothetical protein